MKRILLSKVFALLIISLFVASYFPQVVTITKATPPEYNRVAQPMHKAQPVNPFGISGYSPNQIKNAYNLPSSGGAGDTIAIIDAFDTPNITGDLTAFSNTYGLPAPTSSNFQIVKMAQNIDTNDNWTIETSLDVEWAHAIAPMAKILLVEAISDRESDLLSAVNYARNQPDVVVVSMSWGVSEYQGEVNDDLTFTSNHGVAFFASSGDNGTGVIWPACSANVVAVGGTTLNLDPYGTVISETAWSGSGGGVSTYEPKPACQITYGVPYHRRSVPDVSYNANPSTGVAVYCNSQWHIVGGTSAGAPQWAAIYVLGHSATNANIYGKAKLDYSSYFRDIVTGSNGNPAGPGYDLVTGLGSPITCNFETEVTISPVSGPAGGTIILNGVGFKSNSSVNISWLNPLKSIWTSIANNVITDYNGNLTCKFNAPDLLQNNLAGDNQPIFNNIIFQVKESSNGKSYNSTMPYSEWRRGVTKIFNQSATGIYGNDTDLTSTTFVQNNQSVIVAGNWFNPNTTGVVSLFWDGTISLGTTAIDESGQFNATVQVPTTNAGQHMLTINDGSTNFCINVTRLPDVANNYTTGWHTSDTTINLTPDSNVIETLYKINNGPVFNVTGNGQPVITAEGDNNTLEYWSIWNIYGTSPMELPHVTILGIQLQKTPPQGSIQINNGTKSTFETTVTLSITATDILSGVNQARFSNDNVWTQIPWESYNGTASWQLTIGNGEKTVYCQVKNNAGLIATFNTSITLNTPQPSQTVSPLATSNPSSTPSNSPTPIITPNFSQSPSATKTPTTEPSKTPIVPEFDIQMIVVLLALTTLPIAIAFKKNHHEPNNITCFLNADTFLRASR